MNNKESNDLYSDRDKGKEWSVLSCILLLRTSRCPPSGVVRLGVTSGNFCSLASFCVRAKYISIYKYNGMALNEGYLLY